ncbi:MAG: hypothetical protein WC683_18130 [bacterium]
MSTVKHHDYSQESLARPAPDSPNPRPLIPTGPLHPGACHYPFEMGWVQTAMKPFQEKVLPAVGWTESTRKWLFGIATVILASLVGLGLALGSSCRAAGAQEERLEQVRSAQSAERIERTQMDKQISDEETRRYDKLFDLMVKIHSDVQVLKARDDEERHPGR